MADTKKITWTALAFMAFSTVWGFGNVLNGFIYSNFPHQKWDPHLDKSIL